MSQYAAFQKLKADMLTKGDHPDPKPGARGPRTVKRHTNSKRQHALQRFVKQHGTGHGR